MSRVIAIVNQKGGVGKTTTTVNLGAYLAEMGKKVLLIDTDPQGNTTSGIGLSKSKIQRCVYDVLINDLDLGTVVLPTTYQGLFVAPATIQLAGAEIEMVSALNREFRLRKALEGIRENYDYILMDCPPSLGLLTVNALTAADSVLVPIQCEYYALEGLSQLLNTITLVQKHLNPDLKIAGVALTMFDPRTNLSQQVIDEVQKYFGDKVFKTIIPRNIRLSEAPGYGQAILTYDDKSRGAIAYRELAEEVVSLG